MMKIVAGKQVGPIYYMVKDVEVLKIIAMQEAIRTSVKAEPTGHGDGSYHYVSFMRDLTKADRNPNRWIYGIQLDGDKLSDRYKISPYSFAGNALNRSYYRVKTLIAYDDGTYSLSLVNWPTLEITKKMFEEIESLVVSDSQGVNNKKNLQVSEGKRKYKGRKALVKYNYNTQNGGITLNATNLSAASLSYLTKHTKLNETEERIWILDDNKQFIRITGLITGYIEPKGDDSIEQAIDSGELPAKKILKY